jgi:hypothetical protein
MRVHQFSAELDRWENEGGALTPKRDQYDAQTESRQPRAAGQEAGHNAAPRLARRENPLSSLRARTKGNFHDI